MGEIADMMINGEMCQECGVFLEKSLGYPGLCAGCNSQHARKKNNTPTKKKKSRGRRNKAKAAP